MQVDKGVVRQVLCIIRAVWGIQVDHDERGGHRFLESHPVIVNVRGKLRGSQGLAHLREDQILIRVGLYVEIHDHGRLTVGRGIQRIHVVHVVHASHLLSDRRGHRLLQRLCVCPDVSRLDLNFRRDNIGKLCNRQARDGHRADHNRKNGNDHCHDGATDEEL